MLLPLAGEPYVAPADLRHAAVGAADARHLHRNDQEEAITHWVSGMVPWDAADPA